MDLRYIFHYYYAFVLVDGKCRIHLIEHKVCESCFFGNYLDRFEVLILQLEKVTYTHRLCTAWNYKILLSLTLVKASFNGSLQLPLFTYLISYHLSSQVTVDKVDIALYNISKDPEERVDLSKKFPDIVKEMQMRVKYFVNSSVKPLYQKNDPEALKTAQEKGAWGPWRD